MEVNKVDEIRIPTGVTDFTYYPHAFTEKEALKYYRGWRPSKLLVKWWEISLFFKELYWRIKP